MSGHTPGPWEILWPLGSRNEADIRSDNDGELIAHIYYGNNASLIAAAPDLLATLREALAQLEEWEVKIDGEWGSCRDLDELESDGELSDATLKARAIIAAIEAST